MMDNYIFRVEKSLNKDDCVRLIDIFKDKSFSNYIEKGPKNKYCEDRNFYFYESISLNVLTAPFVSALKLGLKQYVEKYPFLKTRCFEISKVCNLQKYNLGQSYTREHDENSSGVASHSSRMIAWMFYLNTIENGGGTFFPQQNLKTKAMEGDLYIWPAGWTHSHYGLNAEKSKKFIITGWCNYLTDEKRKLIGR